MTHVAARSLTPSEAAPLDARDADMRPVLDAALEAIHTADRVAARRRLLAFASLACQRIQLVRHDMDAVVDANVRAVELVDDHQERTEALLSAKQVLEKEHGRAVAQCKDLSAHVEALQAATVESVMLLDEHEQQLARLREEAGALERARQALEDQAATDALTGLYNHGYLQQRLPNEIARAQRHRRKLSVLFIDIDHFKLINDLNGHAVGDAALRAVCRIVRDTVRSTDVLARMDSGRFVARYGGEELVVILPETDAAGAASVAERLRMKVREGNVPGSAQQPWGCVTVSVGVAELNQEEDAGQLLYRADRAVYAAKSAGRDRVEVAG